jgi:hypothetical protein
MKIPKDWNTEKKKGMSQKEAEQYRDFHRCEDILKGAIKYNPNVHKSEIFKLNGVK